MSTSSVGNRPHTTIPKSNTKKKKKSGLAGILAAFCGTDKGHETEPTRTATKPTVPAPSSVAPTAPTSTVAAAQTANNAGSTTATASPISQTVGTNHLAATSVTETANLEDKASTTTPPVMSAGDASGSQPNSTSHEAGQNGEIPDSDRGDRGVAGPTGATALAPPLPLGHTFNHSTLPVSPVTEMAQAGGLGRDSPAQELGMTDVEMGTEHDRTDDGVIVPPGAGTDGVRVPLDETEGLLSAAVQPPGSGSHLNLSSSSHHLSSSQSRELLSSETPNASIGEDSIMTDNAGDSEHVDQSVAGQESSGQDNGAAYAQDDTMMFDEEPDEDRLIAQGGIGIPIGPDGLPAPLLPPIAPEHTGRKCLVLDLDETLLHSSFKGITSADYIVPVEIESQIHNVYVVKRPGVDNFLLKMGQIYEVVVFTASLSKYADPVLDILDIHKVVKHRLFRESCYNHKGNYVKDLSQLGREMSQSIIIDNSPASYIFHPHNAVPVSTWFNDPHDTELTDLCPFLTDLGTVDDIRGVLDGSL